MAMNTDEIQPTPPQPSSPSHDTNDPLKTGRRRSTTMMISPNLVAALEYDERTRAMTEASSPSIGHIPNPNLLGPGVFRGGLPPPPRTRKNSSTGKTKPRSDGGSLPFQGEVSPANSPPQLPPLRHSPSLSRELLEKPSAWNPYINPAPKLNVSHPPSYTVSAPNSPLHSPEDVHFATTTMLRGHSHTFSAPSSAPMIGHLDATQPNVPRHRRYLSSLVKGKINIGIVKRSEGLRRGDGEVGSVVVIEKRNMSEGRLREIGDNRRESFIGLSNRVIPSSELTDIRLHGKAGRLPMICSCSFYHFPFSI